MEFITIKPNQSPIDQLNKRALQKCTQVDAAVAYVSDESTLIEGCINSGVSLKIWARYGHSVPVTVSVMRKFVGGLFPNLQMRLVADVFHPKIIWWRKFGAYIGSANLTERGWFRNFEAGVFLTEEELYEDGGIAGELEEFLSMIDDRSHALTSEIIDQIDSIDRTDFHKEEKSVFDKFERERRIPRLEGMHDVKRRNGLDRRKAAFLKEWDETLEIMRMIGDRVSLDKSRPAWVRPETPKGVQADQFLHAYYYHYVAEGRMFPFQEHFHKNKDRRDEALAEAIEWWRDLSAAPSREDLTMNEWAPVIREGLAPENIRSLNPDGFFDVCFRIHALQTHARQLNWAHHDRVVPKQQTRETRVRFLSDWLLTQKNQHQQGVLELFEYVLYGGEAHNVPARIFEAATDEKRKIQHLSISSLGEMVGWALPNRFPPRNGRTSKALTALGYDVEIHSK